MGLIDPSAYVKILEQEPAPQASTDPVARITLALQFAVSYGQIDGAHHKTWVIDQMVRALTGCPWIQGTAINFRGQPYQYDRQGESAEYVTLVAEHNAGEDGPNTYTWDVGIPP